MCIACNPGMTTFFKAAACRGNFLQYAALASNFAAFATWGPRLMPAGAKPGAGPADLIFGGGPILTMNDRSPRAEAIAIRGERILVVGRASDAEAHRGPDTRIVDLDGRTLLPGLIDPHMHFAGVQFDDWINVSAINTPTYDKVKAKLNEAVRSTREGDWVRAQMFDPSIT